MSGITNQPAGQLARDTSLLVRVHDDCDALTVVTDHLERREERVEVATAADAAEAGQLVADRRVDCVLADVDAGGIELVERLRERDEELPVVVFAPGASPHVVDAALVAGATDIVADAAPRHEIVANRIEQFVADYRARRQAEHVRAELREQANLLDQLFEHVPVGLYVKDREARHVRMSDYDVDPDEVLGKTDPEIYGDTEFARQTLADDLRVIETGEPVVNKEEYNPETGEWTLTSKGPWYGDDGEVKGLIGVSCLITEKKEYEDEIERTNDRLERFTGIVSHDLRAPLNVAMGHLEIVRERYDDEHVDEIATSLDRMDDLIDDLLTLARQGEELEDIDEESLHAVARDAWAGVPTAAATLEVVDDGTVSADRARLEQCLQNLFRNAVEHGGDGVAVRVGTLADGFYVADDGEGIPSEEHERVLSAGYTTADDGTGFGLSIVQEIAAAHGWWLEVTASEDGGARFEFRDPDGDP